ncbi:MAG: hypothetical protein JNM18_19640 [Planctomycetaceae bacterium]|nr:hypothetical protein [Planctomycetaceae bacterium]
MHPLRRWLLIVAPLPILSASWSLTHWTGAQLNASPEPNHVVAVPVAPRVAGLVTSADHANAADGALRLLCDTQAEHWRRQLGPECAVIVRPPFVLAGDLTHERLDDWHQQTIAPAMRALTYRYFSTQPDEPISILLWSTESSYNQYARRLFGDEDVSVYGYYRPQLRTLVMNISTGGGTLVHELTHALAAFDFPGMPEWFNEGLASLHEACRIREDGTGLDGLVNWRLDGLQSVAQAGQLPSLRDLVRRRDFRGPQIGLNYAQARYLCLFLQQQGKLDDFYQTAKEQRHADPTGHDALIGLFEHRDWSRLDREFSSWVANLRRD